MRSKETRRIMNHFFYKKVVLGNLIYQDREAYPKHQTLLKATPQQQLPLLHLKYF